MNKIYLFILLLNNRFIITKDNVININDSTKGNIDNTSKIIDSLNFKEDTTIENKEINNNPEIINSNIETNINSNNDKETSIILNKFNEKNNNLLLCFLSIFLLGFIFWLIKNLLFTKKDLNSELNYTNNNNDSNHFDNNNVNSITNNNNVIIENQQSHYNLIINDFSQENNQNVNNENCILQKNNIRQQNIEEVIEFKENVTKIQELEPTIQFTKRDENLINLTKEDILKDNKKKEDIIEINGILEKVIEFKKNVTKIQELEPKIQFTLKDQILINLTKEDILKDDFNQIEELVEFNNVLKKVIEFKKNVTKIQELEPTIQFTKRDKNLINLTIEDILKDNKKKEDIIEINGILEKVIVFDKFYKEIIDCENQKILPQYIYSFLIKENYIFPINVEDLKKKPFFFDDLLLCIIKKYIFITILKEHLETYLNSKVKSDQLKDVVCNILKNFRNKHELNKILFELRKENTESLEDINIITDNIFFNICTIETFYNNNLNIDFLIEQEYKKNKNISLFLKINNNILENFKKLFNAIFIFNRSENHKELDQNITSGQTIQFISEHKDRINRIIETFIKGERKNEYYNKTFFDQMNQNCLLRFFIENISLIDNLKKL